MVLSCMIALGVIATFAYYYFGSDGEERERARDRADRFHFGRHR